MRLAVKIPTEDYVMSELGRGFMAVLYEAEVSTLFEDREHGRWLRQAILDKLDEQHRSYH